jgi:glycosyltransferase involved in cell wall biosynthesis
MLRSPGHFHLVTAVKMAPWCTVMVPVFNGERYLEELVSSIIKSANEQINLMFIDDASGDQSIRIVSASRLPRMQLIRNEHNLGLYATINKALGYVDTDYVSLLFQDDVIEDTYLEQMKQLASTHVHASFLWPAITIIDDANTERSKGLDTGRVEVISPGVRAWRYAIKRGTFWTISGSVSKTERLRHHGFRVDLPHCADYDFLLRAIREDTFLYFERPLVKIREHAGQASATNLAKSVDFLERISIYREHKSRFRKDFDLLLRLSKCLQEMRHVTRRALGQAGRGSFRQACSTLALLPSIISSILP